MNKNSKELSASAAGDVSLGGEISVHRLGFGAMRVNRLKVFGDHRKIEKAR